jgi:Undecaprenyl-phosphate glucose phosphotransferase
VQRGVSGIQFSILAVLADALVIIAAAVASGAIYHVAFLDVEVQWQRSVEAGALLALFYVVPLLFRDAYAVTAYLKRRTSPRSAFLAWNTAFVCLGAAGFLTKTTAVYSRGSLVMLYIAGGIAVIGVTALLRRYLRNAFARGYLRPRAIMLAGTPERIAAVRPRFEGAEASATIVATFPLNADAKTPAALPSRETLQAMVKLAAESGTDDVVIALDWKDEALIDLVATTLSEVAIGVHVSPPGIFDRFTDARVSRLAETSVVSLVWPPLGPMQLLVKRSFDIVVATVALGLLAPLFAAVAVLIRLDSAGPVFFRQTRGGYNQRTFLIWKFRTMTVTEDGSSIVAAKRGDARVTPIGRILRKYNIDELPQLINVLLGEMSIVGPRPHAVSHDHLYGIRIEDYPRRLRVKPGITGWAQINGLRGSAERDEDMRERVAADLYYAENYSLLLDLYIIGMTVVSPKAYRNAY